MKIVNVNGRLETTGTWEDLAEQAAACKASIMQQRTELRAMLSGNVQFHEDPHGLPVVGVDPGMVAERPPARVTVGVDLCAPGGDKTVVAEWPPAPVKGFQFRVGDVVECIEPGESQRLQAGCRYRVRAMVSGTFVSVDGTNGVYSSKRFKLVQRTRYEVGDKVCFTNGDLGVCEIARHHENGYYSLRYENGLVGGACWTPPELTPVL